MDELKGSKTEKSLLSAFAGESRANRRYLAFAKQADKEAYPQVARLFRAAAEAETVHAHAHLRALGGVRSTAENLKEAISGETHEFTKMYPAMIEDAEGEGNKAAERTFTYANEVEKVHEAPHTVINEEHGVVGRRAGNGIRPCGAEGYRQVVF